MRANRWSVIVWLGATLTGVGQGRVVFKGPVPSQAFGGVRTVRIHLPASYERELTRRYPVLYFHDGQAGLRRDNWAEARKNQHSEFSLALDTHGISC